jgi:hypothetical protein
VAVKPQPLAPVARVPSEVQGVSHDPGEGKTDSNE